MSIQHFGLTIIIHGYREQPGEDVLDNDESDISLKVDMPIVDRASIENGNPALASVFAAFDATQHRAETPVRHKKEKAQ